VSLYGLDRCVRNRRFDEEENLRSICRLACERLTNLITTAAAEDTDYSIATSGMYNGRGVHGEGGKIFRACVGGFKRCGGWYLTAAKCVELVQVEREQRGRGAQQNPAMKIEKLSVRVDLRFEHCNSSSSDLFARDYKSMSPSALRAQDAAHP